MENIISQQAIARQARQRGFSLVEFAIVMGVAGIIVGGIWTYASDAWTKIRSEQLSEGIRLTVTNMQAAYTGKIGIPQKGASATSSDAIMQGIIPSSFIRPASIGGCTNPGGHCADTPWGPYKSGGTDPAGTFLVCDWNLSYSGCGTAGPTPAQLFAIVTHGLNIDGCIRVATSASSPGGPPGLLEVNINGCNTVANTGCGSYVTSKALPVSTADAVKLCVNPPSFNSLRFIYKLRNQ